MASSGQLRVLHVIAGLGTGGAEMMLAKLVEETLSPVCSKVLVLMDRSALSSKVESLGADIEYLGLSQGRLPNLLVFLRLLSVSRRFGPDVIQGWMYHGNLAAWVVSRFACPRARLFWNIRQTLYDLALEKQLTRWLIAVSRWVSAAPESIIYNSVLSSTQHEAVGYPNQSTVVIPNGFDLCRFRPDESARESVRQEFGLASLAPLVIHIARYHPMKDHFTLLQAIKRLSGENLAARFLLVGHGVTECNQVLYGQRNEFGLQDSLILAGERFDVPRLMAAADLAVLSSAWGEGFPNVVGEAMACGTPCVVTDIGDAAKVVGDCGLVVPPRDPDALAMALGQLLSEHDLRKILGNKARQRIQELFSIEKVARTYLDLYEGKLI